MLLLNYCIIFCFTYICKLTKYTIYHTKKNLYYSSQLTGQLKVENNYSISNVSNILYLLAQNKLYYPRPMQDT